MSRRQLRKRFAQIVEADVPREDFPEVFGVELLLQLKAEDGAGVGGVNLDTGKIGAKTAELADGFAGDFRIRKRGLFFQKLKVGEQFCADADGLFFQCDMHFF